MGEARRQVRLPESFVLEDIPAPNPVVLQRRNRGRSLPTTAPSSRATSVAPVAEALLQVPLFSAQQLSDLEVDVASVFEMAATLCKPQGQGPTAIAAMVDKGGYEDEEASSDMDVYAAISRVKTMPRRPAIERSSITPGVVMVDNRNGVVQLVGPLGQVFTPTRILLDSGAQPLMFGRAAIEGLGLTKETLELCPFTINTSTGGSEKAYGLTAQPLVVRFKPDDVMDSSAIKVQAVVTKAESYDVLVGATILYPMGFQMDYWSETTSYRPGWQAGDGRTATLPTKFIRGEPGLHGVFAMTGSGDYSSEDEGCQPLTVPTNPAIDNRHRAKVNRAARVWADGATLHRQAADTIHKVWTDQEWVSRYKPAEFIPLNSPVLTTPIPWQPPNAGICLVELFGGIATGLAAILQTGIKVRQYVYVDIDPVARQVARAHIRTLRQQYPTLLPREATRRCFTALSDDIRLIDDVQLRLLGHVDLVIAGWPCQGMSMAGKQNGLYDRRTALFGELIRILRTLQLLQTSGPGYLVENVPVKDASSTRNLAGLKRIETILGPSVSIDAAQIGSRAHRYRQWWTNIIPTEVLQAAYKHTRRPPNF